jgi:hypothetical protein
LDASDAANGLDAAREGALVSDGGRADSSRRWCADAGHYLCEDFDEPDALGGWTLPADVTPGTLAVAENLAAPSPPFALHATDKRRTVTHRVQIAKRLDHAWQRTILQFDAFVVAPVSVAGDTNGNGLATLNFYSSADGGGATQGAALSFGAPAAGAVTGHLSFGASSNMAPPVTRTASVFPFNRWVHFAFDALPGSDADAGSFVLDMDGDAGHWQVDLPSITVGATNVYVQLELGSIGYNQPSPDLDITIDNVTVDFVSP